MKKLMAIAATTALTGTVVGGPAVNAATTVKLKNNKLVYTKTGKVVKGYKVYKKKLYKDGKLSTGRVKYGKGKNMKLYYNGTLQKGFYRTKDHQYIFSNGSLQKGSFTTYDIGLVEVYKDGVRTNKIYIKDDKLYDNNKLKKGKFVINNYVFDMEFLSLFIDGHLAKGLYKGKYGENGKTYLFKDGDLANVFYEGKLYYGGEIEPPNTFGFDDNGLLYFNHQLYTGIYDWNEFSDSDDLEMYENGKPIYRVALKAYLDQLAIVQALDQVDTTWNKEVVKLIDILVENAEKIEGSYGGQLIAENPPELGEEDVYPFEEYGNKQLLQELTDLRTRLQAIPNTEQAQQAIEKGIKAVYALQKLHYENGALLDGVYEGNYYEKGRFINSELNYALSEDKNAVEAALREYKEKIATAEDQEMLTQQLIEKLMQKVKTAQAIGVEHQHPTYPNVEVNIHDAKWAIEETIDQYRYIEDTIKKYAFSVDVSPLLQAIREASGVLDMEVSLEEIDTQATYKPLTLNETQTGQFDKNGFAYFKVDLQDKEGVYEIAGDYSFDHKDANVWLSNQLETLPTQQALPTKKNLYLEQGTHYLVVRGKANDSYEFAMNQYQFNYKEKLVWPIQSNSTGSIDLPYYKYEQIRIPVELTSNEHLEFYVGARTYDYDLNKAFKGIKDLTMTNDITGETYPLKKLTYAQTENVRFLTDAPKGKYTLTYKAPENVYGEGAKLHWETFTPIAFLNKKDISAPRTTFVIEKDTKIRFTLTRGVDTSYSSPNFDLRDENFGRIRQKNLDMSTPSIKFNYTLKKGKYYLYLDNMKLSTTVK